MKTIASAPGPLPAPERLSSTEMLTGIRSTVDLDGENAFFDVQFSNMRAFRAQIPFTQIPHLLTELRSASAALMQRQRCQLDRGADALLTMCESALRPAHIEVMADPVTGDRFIIHQFYNHAPIVFRVSPLEMHFNMALVARGLARLMH